MKVIRKRKVKEKKDAGQMLSAEQVDEIFESFGGKKSNKTILTNDPSMTAWGWVVLTPDGQILKSGCIKTGPESKKARIRKSDDRLRRVSEINRMLLEIIKENNVRLILSESPHGSQNASGAVMIGMVAGILQTISDCLDIPIEWYSEQDAKRCISGKRSLTKQEMAELVENKYGVQLSSIKYVREAVADALAVHNVAMEQSSMIKMLK